MIHLCPKMSDIDINKIQFRDVLANYHPCFVGSNEALWKFSNGNDLLKMSGIFES